MVYRVAVQHVVNIVAVSRASSSRGCRRMIILLQLMMSRRMIILLMLMLMMSRRMIILLMLMLMAVV